MPILLNEIECEDTKLESCRSWKLGGGNCRHENDVFLTCTNEIDVTDRITVHYGSVINALTVDGLRIGTGGGESHIDLAGNEKITRIQFGHPMNTFWPSGTMCALTMYSNTLQEYGPYSARPDCTNIAAIEIPSNMSFKPFFQAKAGTVSNHNAEVLHIDRD